MYRLSIAVPHPYPDELLYSVLARSRYYLAEGSPKRLSAILFGNRSQLAVPDLPGNLEALRWLFGDKWRLSLKELAYKHTLFGYYTRFLGAADRASVLARMGGHDVRGLHAALGICASNVRVISRFRLCPDCVETDLALEGETYWRRTHQLPGVCLCSTHGTPLVETVVPFRPTGRHEFVAASASHLETATAMTALTAFETATALSVAKASAALLDEESFEAARHGYGERLADAGYGREHGARMRLRADFLAHYGEGFLSDIFRNGQEGVARWLDEVRRTPRRGFQPLQHVLLEGFLLSREQNISCDLTGPDTAARPKTWGIYRSDSLRNQADCLATQGLTTRQIALQLDVSWKTAHRLQQPMVLRADGGKTDARRRLDEDRQAWAELARANPLATKKRLRQLEPALYMRLYRNDPHFTQAPVGAGKAPRAGSPRVVWPHRDEMWARRIHEVAVALRQARPLVRVTPHRVLGELQARALFAHYWKKLPQACLALEQLCETTRQFQLRRMAAVLEDDPECPDWKLFRKAAIKQPAAYSKEMLMELKAIGAGDSSLCMPRVTTGS